MHVSITHLRGVACNMEVRGPPSHTNLRALNCAGEQTLERPTVSMTAIDEVNLGHGVTERGQVNERYWDEDKPILWYSRRV